MSKPPLTPEEVASLVGDRPAAGLDTVMSSSAAEIGAGVPPSADVLPELRERVERFRCALAASLSQTLRTAATVTVHSAERRSAGHRRLGGGDAGCFVTLRPARQDIDVTPARVRDPRCALPLLLQVDLDLLFSAIERLLGGRLQPSRVIRRSLTAIEKRLAGNLAAQVADEWQRAWSGSEGPAWTAERIDAKPPTDALSEAREPIAVVRFAVAFGGVAGRMSLDIPWPLAVRPHPSESAADAPTEAAGHPTLELAVVLAELQLSARDVRNLEVGDVIETDVCVSQPITVTLNGQAIFEGLPGTADGRKAVRLQ